MDQRRASPQDNREPACATVRCDGERRSGRNRGLAERYELVEDHVGCSMRKVANLASGAVGERICVAMASSYHSPLPVWAFQVRVGLTRRNVLVRSGRT